MENNIVQSSSQNSNASRRLARLRAAGGGKQGGGQEEDCKESSDRAKREGQVAQGDGSDEAGGFRGANDADRRTREELPVVLPGQEDRERPAAEDSKRGEKVHDQRHLGEEESPKSLIRLEDGTVSIEAEEEESNGSVFHDLFVAEGWVDLSYLDNHFSPRELVAEWNERAIRTQILSVPAFMSKGMFERWVQDGHSERRTIR